MLGSARFDDLTPGSERSFRLARPLAVLEATAPEEVAEVLAEADGAAAGGSWVAGFVAYEAAPGLDASLRVRARRPGDPFGGMPLAWFAVFGRREPITPPSPAGSVDRGSVHWTPSVERGAYERAVGRIRELIAEGRTYQVNHTIRLRSDGFAATQASYERLCLAQRGAYAAMLDTGRFRILSASPELFFLRDGARVVTRPMKGTAARGRWPEEDEARAAALVASSKDRAENAMIVDLLRNDLGRIAIPGTVRVDRLFQPERYETVWQLTSTISALVPDGTPLVQVFRALFPSGSVTGAPKVAAMGFIAELEDAPRGPYTGAIGFLAPKGSGEPDAVFNVAIRTVVVDLDAGIAEYGVGGGITYDSSPRGEYEEVVAKSRLLAVEPPGFELLETLRWEPGSGPRHIAEHLERLRASARHFGFAFDRQRIVTAVEKAGADCPGPCRIRLTLARDGGVAAEGGPLPEPPPGPARVALDPDPVDPRDVWLYHKTTMREPYDRRRERRPDIEDVLLVNARGELTESTIANVAVRLGGTWWTPPLDAGLLPGTYRAMLLEDGTLRERTIAAKELAAAEGLALVSSVRGWRPAVLVP